MQSIVVLSVGYTKCHIQAICAESHYTECRYADCRNANFSSSYEIIIESAATDGVIKDLQSKLRPFCSSLPIPLQK